MINALSITVDEDLQRLSQHLWATGVAHRISEQAGHQIVWVASQADVEKVHEVYQRYQQGTLPEIDRQAQHEVVSKRRAPHTGLEQVFENLRAVPCISVLIAISVVATTLLGTGIGHQVFELLRMGTLEFIFQSAQLWRLITPIFLHFDLMHLAFNMVLLWVFGRQLELHEKRGTLLILLLLFAVIPNVAQNLLVGIRFGGMSGLVYAVLAYCWLYNRLSRQAIFAFPAAMMGLMVGWLLLGFTDILTWLGFPPMANIAHLAGLLIGLLCGWGRAQITSFHKQS